VFVYGKHESMTLTPAQKAPIAGDRDPDQDPGRGVVMNEETFGELLDSMNEALEHARGKRQLRTTTLPAPLPPLDGRAVKRVRAGFRASQAVFARYLNVSTNLVQAWEADRRTPGGAALVLLHIAATRPDLIETVRRRERQHRPARAAARAERRARSSGVRT
jgi:putative transcriptional regulator